MSAAESTSVTTDEEQEPSPPPWELHDHLTRLQRLTPSELVGERRMGAGMAFRSADRQVADVVRVIDELRLDWDRLSPQRRSEVVGTANSFVQIVESIMKMDSSRVDTTVEGTTWSPDQVRQQRDTWEAELTRLHQWFFDNAQPLCVSAPARRAAEDYIRAETASLSEAQIRELRQTFAELREQAAEFERLRPVVEAQRELLGESGTTKVSAHFDDEAKGHGVAWKWWLGALLGWVLVSGIGGVIFIDETRPADDATNAQIASHLFLDLLVIGLALYIVRILSLQFRAHRHMEVIARNKASALSTFNQLIVGMEPEVKTVVAAALAQSVFSADDAIFADGSAEHVTILERVLSPGIERLRS